MNNDIKNKFKNMNFNFSNDIEKLKIKREILDGYIYGFLINCAMTNDYESMKIFLNNSLNFFEKINEKNSIEYIRKTVSLLFLNLIKDKNYKYMEKYIEIMNFLNIELHKDIEEKEHKNCLLIFLNKKNINNIELINDFLLKENSIFSVSLYYIINDCYKNENIIKDSIKNDLILSNLFLLFKKEETNFYNFIQKYRDKQDVFNLLLNGKNNDIISFLFSSNLYVNNSNIYNDLINSKNLFDQNHLMLRTLMSSLKYSSIPQKEKKLMNVFIRYFEEDKEEQLFLTIKKSERKHNVFSTTSLVDTSTVLKNIKEKYKLEKLLKKNNLSNIKEKKINNKI